MHCFWIMIFLSFDFLDSSKKGKYDYLVAKSGKSIFFAWKVGKMCGRMCVVCDQLKNVHAHTVRTHVLKVFSPAHVRPHITRVLLRTHLRNPYLDFFETPVEIFLTHHTNWGKLILARLISNTRARKTIAPQ